MCAIMCARDPQIAVISHERMDGQWLCKRERVRSRAGNGGMYDATEHGATLCRALVQTLATDSLDSFRVSTDNKPDQAEGLERQPRFQWLA